MKISILGSESFLAKNLIHYIKENNRDIIIYGYDFCDDGLADNYCKIDFSSVNSIRKVKFDVDAVLIFMGRTGNVNSFNEYESFITVNEIYLLNIFKCYSEQKYRPRIIYPGSRLLFAESKDKINECSKIYPKSVYAVTKLTSELYLNIYKHMFGLDYVILRICTPYGSLIDSNGSYGTFEIFYNQAIREHRITVFGDGSQTKTYTQMIDICKAFLLLIQSEKIKFTDYNLGGQALSLNDVASYLADQNGAEVVHISWPNDYKAVDGGTVIFDSTRFDKEFNMSYHKVIE